MHDDYLEPIFLLSGMFESDRSMTRACFLDCLEGLPEVALTLLGFSQERPRGWLYGLCLFVLRKVIAKSQALKSAVQSVVLHY